MSVNDDLIKNENAKKVMSRIALKIDTWENWQKEAAQNLVLHAGEVAFVQVGTVPPMGTGIATGSKTDGVHLNVAPNQILFKVGDGVSKFKDLVWGSAVAADVYGWAKQDEAAFKDWLADVAGFTTNVDFNEYRGELFEALFGEDPESLASRLAVIEGYAGIGGEGAGTLATVKDVEDLEKKLVGTGESTISTIKGAAGAAVRAQATADEAQNVATGAAGWIATNKTNLEKVSADPVTKTEVEGAIEDAIDTAKEELIGDDKTADTIKYAEAAAAAAHSTANEALGKVNTLIGTDADANKSVRTIANEELAAQLIPANAKDALNELQEIAAWIQSHPDDASAMNGAITELQRIVAGLGTVGEGDAAQAKTVKKYVEDAIAASEAILTEDIQTAIEGLDVSKVTVGANKTLVSIEQKDGKIETSAVDIEITKNQIRDFNEGDYATANAFNNHLAEYTEYQDHALLDTMTLFIDCGSASENVN